MPKLTEIINQLEESKGTAAYLDAVVNDVDRTEGRLLKVGARVDQLSLEGSNIKYEAPCRPTLDLDFVNQDFTIYSPTEGFVKKPLADIMDITRASNGTSVNALGGITTLGVDQPRYEFDGKTGAAKGILLEGSAINLIPWSEDLTQWMGLGSVSLGDTKQVGDVLIREVTDNSTTVNGQVSSLVTLVASTAYTYSFFLAKGTSSKFRGSVQGLGAAATAVVGEFIGDDLLISATRGSAQYEKVSGGYRVSLTLDPADVTGGNVFVYMWPANYVVGGTTTGSVYFGGAQLTATPYPVSYIKTEASTVTRASEYLQSTDIQINPTQGSILLKWDSEVPTSSNNATLFSLSNQSGTRRIEVRKHGVNQYLLVVTFTGLPQLSTTFFVSGLKSFIVSYSPDGVFFAANGSYKDPSFSRSLVFDGNSTLTIGRNHALAGFSQLNVATFRRMSIYPRAFDSLTLQRLTRI